MLVFCVAAFDCQSHKGNFKFKLNLEEKKLEFRNMKEIGKREKKMKIKKRNNDASLLP